MNIVIATQGIEFHGDTLKERSLGGSETAVICVAKELAKLGNSVTVYCNCDKEGIFDGVEYLNIDMWQDFIKAGECDILIVSRFMQMFANKANSKLNILWNHDIIDKQTSTMLYSMLWNIDYMYCLSNYHKKQYIEHIPEIEPIIKLNTNGIDWDLVPDKAEKKHKIMFTSRPERGLYHTLQTFEALNDKDLELLICNYKTIPSEEVERIESICLQKADELVAKGFKITTGQFTKADLYKHIAESKAVLYGTQFPEISCISAMEAQVCGTAYIATDDFALSETVGYEGIKLDDKYNENFLNRVKEVLTNDDFRKNLEEQGKTHSKDYNWQVVTKRFMEDAQEEFDKRDTTKKIKRLLYNSDIVMANKVLKGIENPTAEQKELLAETEHDLRFVRNPEMLKEIYEDEETHEVIDLEWKYIKKNTRFNWVAELINKDGVKTVMDYACHMGWASIVIGNNNPDCTITGYDISKGAIDKAISRLDKYSENKNINFVYNEDELGQFDAVFCGEYLEHTLNPKKEVEKLLSHVKDGGKVYITIPKGAWEYLSRDQNKRKDVYYHIQGFDANDVLLMFGKQKDFKLDVMHNLTGAYGECLGNYLISFTKSNIAIGDNLADDNCKFKLNTSREHVTISAITIAKNAQYNIEKMLNSMKDKDGNYEPDQIIIGDDFSDDKTIERAEAMGAEVYQLPAKIVDDKFGFGEARNFTLDKATGDWIVWLDTDEVFKTKEPWRKYLDCPFIQAYIIKQFHPQRDSYVEADKPQRMFKRGAGRFYGYIHEQVQSDINNSIKPDLILEGFEVWNMGSAVEQERRTKALDRNLPLLDKDWKENVIAKEKAGEPIRKLTPILVIRDLLNRMYWSYEAFGTYETREFKERILPRIFQLYNKYYRNEENDIYKNLADNIMQNLFKAIGVGHDIDIVIDENKQIKKRYVDLKELIKDIERAI